MHTYLDLFSSSYFARFVNGRYAKHYFFAIFTLIAVSTYGYYVGTFDQVSHIPFLKKYADPTLYPNDKYFDLRNTHYSFFWLFFVPFQNLKILEITMFATHIFTLYCTFWAIWNISFTIFRSKLASFISAISMIAPHFSFSAFPFLEFSLLNRSFALPFEILALNYYLKKKYFLSFLLFGLLYNIHVISVNFFLVMVGFDLIFRHREFGIAKICKYAGTFVICAMPVLYWKFSSTPIMTEANWEWFHLLSNALFFNLFSFISINVPHVTFISLGGIASIYLFFAFSRNIKSMNLEDGSDYSQTFLEQDQKIRRFVYGGIAILLLQIFTTYLYPSVIVVQSQISRVGVILTLFTYIYGAGLAAKLYRKKSPGFIAFFAALTLSFTPIILFFTFFIRNRISTFRYSVAISSIILFVALIIVATSIKAHLISPSVNIFPQKNAWNDTQFWAKNNTPKDTLFVTPPGDWWFDNTDWRAFSERSTVSTISELFEAAFDPSYIPYWKVRFEDVAPGVQAKFNGNVFDSLQNTKVAYNMMTTKQLMNIAKKYDAKYAVVDKHYVHNLPISYQNGEYTIYRLQNVQGDQF